MIRKLSIVLLGGAALAGCYHVTVVTGAPANNTVVDKEWQLAFVSGLVPPAAVGVKAECPKGVAKFETEQSFLNMLVGSLSSSLITPMHTSLTCASGPVQKP